jgi:hypothetical protein
MNNSHAIEIKIKPLITIEDTAMSKGKLYTTGVVVGALVGLVTAMLLQRNAEQNDGQLHVSSSDLLQTSLGIISAMRGVAALGAKTV